MADNLSGIGFPATNFMDMTWGDDVTANVYGTAASASAADSAGSVVTSANMSPESYTDTLKPPNTWAGLVKEFQSVSNPNTLKPATAAADKAASSHWSEPTTYIAVILALIVIAVGLFAIASSSAVSSAVGALKNVK